MNGDKLKEQIMAFAPLLVSIVLLINTYLSSKGLPCIGLTETDITTLVSGIASVAAVIWTWWTNNNVTENAQISQLVLDSIKSGILSQDDVLNFIEAKANEAYKGENHTEEEVKEIVDRSEYLDNDD